ncbi:MAG: Uncharacterized protein G01um10148_147 [Parcubacteria group bacterium Gr01-1014_8]|nr:MAG: Uncharacterized protein G01um10148_147 [Parcubacteria group bacterium Gr01-1014_8]
MGKRGPKPGFKITRRVSEKWTPELAYAIGLLATDGCLARHQSLIDLTSKDQEQLKNFSKCIGIPLFIGTKFGSHHKGVYYRVQFKNLIFYNFLLSVGLTPAKSKTMGALGVPKEYFWDFLRGSYDGDGCSYSYWDPRWKSSFMFYTSFVSASREHIDWLQKEIFARLKITGHITQAKRNILYQLKYAKSDSLKLLKKMYHSSKVICLSRKRLKIERILSTVSEKL